MEEKSLYLEARNVWVVALLAVIFCFCAGCFSPWEGDTGTLTVSVGNSAGNRAVSQEIIDGLYHIVEITGGLGPEQGGGFKGSAGSLNFSVFPGTWTISITAYAYNEDYTSWKDYRGGEQVAYGATTTEIKPGPNGNIIITMTFRDIDVPGPDDDITYELAPIAGADGETTTGIRFTFDAPIDDLDVGVGDIEIEKYGEAGHRVPFIFDGAAFGKTENDIWVLSPLTVTHTETVYIRITKEGIDPAEHNVAVYIKGEELPEEWTVTWEFGNGQNPYAEPVPDGAYLEAPNPAPTREHYSFEGWYYLANGSEHKWNFATDQVTSDITVYAKWQRLTYTITFHSDGVEVQGLSMEVAAGESAAALPSGTNLSKPGWIFEGWHHANDPDTILQGAYTPTGHITLHAKWSRITHTVTFSSNNTTITTETVGEGDKVSKPADPTRAGYSFVNWYEGNNVWDFDSNEIITSITLNAQWTKDLIISVSPSQMMLSPIDKSFEVTVSGFMQSADIDEVGFDINSLATDLPELAFNVTNTGTSNDTVTFTVIVEPVSWPASASLALPSIAIADYLTSTLEGYTAGFKGDATVAPIGIIDGSENNPILITGNNIARFNKYARATNTYGKFFKLTEDVDLTKVDLSELDDDLEPGETWIAAGTNATPTFLGTFDGDDHTISGLTINRPMTNYQGMFARLTAGGVVKNLNLADVSVTGRLYVGGIVGDMAASNTIIENCSVTGGTIIAGGDYAGGITGNNGSDGTIQYCYSTCDVTSTTGRYVGGVLGDNSPRGTVQHCYSTGNVTGYSYVGGVVGNVPSEYGTVQYCYATGNVTGNNAYVGGIVGQQYASTTGIMIGYCVALNTAIAMTSPTGVYGRITGGGSDYFLNNNYAREDLAIVGSSPAGLNLRNGADVPEAQYTTVDFWRDTMGWDFDDIWEWDDDEKLPKLQNVGPRE